jgi:hypothetical protein
VENTSKFPWNDYDEKTLTYAKRRCTELYEEAPCLKFFVKYDKKDYRATCGAEIGK